jgi:hypothetical protein
MIYLTVIAAIAIALLPLLRSVDAKDRQQAEAERAVERKAWAEERQVLLERIQRPEVPPVRQKPRAVTEQVPRDHSEFAKVGTVTFDPKAPLDG